jgi:hypothetical protein
VRVCFLGSNVFRPESTKPKNPREGTRRSDSGRLFCVAPSVLQGCAIAWGRVSLEVCTSTSGHGETRVPTCTPYKATAVSHIAALRTARIHGVYIIIEALRIFAFGNIFGNPSRAPFADHPSTPSSLPPAPPPTDVFSRRNNWIFDLSCSPLPLVVPRTLLMGRNSNVSHQHHIVAGQFTYFTRDISPTLV